MSEFSGSHFPLKNCTNSTNLFIYPILIRILDFLRVQNLSSSQNHKEHEALKQAESRRVLNVPGENPAYPSHTGYGSTIASYSLSNLHKFPFAEDPL